MSNRKNDSCNCAKYRTISIIPEEILREYGRKLWMEKIDELYEQIKQKIMELPIDEAQE